jgi:hypothetical protein
MLFLFAGHGDLTGNGFRSRAWLVRIVNPEFVDISSARSFLLVFIVIVLDIIGFVS